MKMPSFKDIGIRDKGNVTASFEHRPDIACARHENLVESRDGIATGGQKGTLAGAIMLRSPGYAGEAKGYVGERKREERRGERKRRGGRARFYLVPRWEVSRYYPPRDY